MADPERATKCLLLPMGERGLLLPNPLVAEIITQQAVVEYAGTPPWFLGTGGWRGTDIPLVSFECLCDEDREPPEPAGRYVVVFSLEPAREPAYYGLRIDALPRSEAVDGERLASQPREPSDPAVVALRGRLGDRDCLIPDVDRLVETIRGAMS